MDSQSVYRSFVIFVIKNQNFLSLMVLDSCLMDAAQTALSGVDAQVDQQ